MNDAAYLKPRTYEGDIQRRLTMIENHVVQSEATIDPRYILGFDITKMVEPQLIVFNIDELEVTVHGTFSSVVVQYNNASVIDELLVLLACDQLGRGIYCDSLGHLTPLHAEACTITGFIIRRKV
mgnify:CR=1 FL=1